MGARDEVAKHRCMRFIRKKREKLKDTYNTAKGR